MIHVPQGERVKNELDRDELFLAVTDAHVPGPDAKPLHRVALLAVCRTQIVWIIPQQDERLTA
jgi:hypothetical protein